MNSVILGLINYAYSRCRTFLVMGSSIRESVRAHRIFSRAPLR